MLVKDLVHCVYSGRTLLVNLFISKKFFTITVFIFHFHLFLAPPQSDKNFKDITVMILNIGTDMSEQTVQTQIRLLLMEQSDQGLLCLLFCLHLLNTILHCKIQPFQL